MWSPTHIQVTVQRAKGLLTKGKNDTNNCFVTIGLGKEKYQTSVKEKSEPNVSWNEECELKIPDQGNKAELILTCLHRNNLGIDEFLGQITLPLNEMDVYDRPRSKWFALQSKPGKEKKNKYRGELEVRINFVVKSGSLTDLSKKEKHKSSIGQLASSVGGSLLSIGTLEKRKGIKKFAKSLGSKMHLNSKKKNKDVDTDNSSYNGSFVSIDVGTNNSYNSTPRHGQRAGEADPGVISEDEDEFVFDKLSHKSSGSSLNVRSKYIETNSSLLNVSENRWSKGKQSDEITLSESESRSSKATLAPPSNRAFESTETSIEADIYQKDENINFRETANSKMLGGVVFDEPVAPQADSFEPKPSVLNDNQNDKTNVDEWETKLYLDFNKSDSLKRSSWQPAREPINLYNRETASSNKIEEALLNEKTPVEDDDYSVKEVTFDVKESVLSDKQNDRLSKSYTDEWESKLYLDLNKSDSLKRNTWQSSRVQIPGSNEQRISPRASLDENNFVMVDKEADQSKAISAIDEIRDPESNDKHVPINENLQSHNVSGDEMRVHKDDITKLDPETENIEENENKDLKEKKYSNGSMLKKLPIISQRNGKSLEKIKRVVEGEMRSSPTHRIIIGHEKSKQERNSDMLGVLEKKYEGKSREELMFIANGMETEVFKYRQRVKELEDYLDNLLLRVMETHPKILQNPYSRTTSVKSG